MTSSVSSVSNTMHWTTTLAILASFGTLTNFQKFTRHILIFFIVGVFTQTIKQSNPMHTRAVDFFVVGGVVFGEYHNHTCAEDRTVIVQLFNWLWTDIEKECVDYLGPKGFC